MSTQPIITARDVTFYYLEEVDNRQLLALKDVSIAIERGSLVAILGHNGSGKSTLAKHFNAIFVPKEGSVEVNGIDTRDEEKLYDIRQQVGMVFQNPDNQLVATVVEEDVAFACENLGVPPADIRKRVDDALKAVGMYELRDRSPHQLSGGQKQRVAIAGIIAMMPDCIVLDEPTAMLDPRGREEVMRTIRQLGEEFGITVVLITHYMDEAARADRVVVMDDGRIALDGTPCEVFRHVEQLKRIGLDVPQTTELVHQLRAEGLTLPDDILSEEACIDALVSLMEE